MRCYYFTTFLSYIVITKHKWYHNIAVKIEKKTWPEYFQALFDGTKTFDIRLANFDCKVGDSIVFREWDPHTQNYYSPFSY